jgi:predicted chitinase
MTLEELVAIMPKLGPIRAGRFLPFLKAAMDEGAINTPRRQAAFLAQVAHESGELHYWEELASGKAYERRTDLGNTPEDDGDGPKYKGRGPLQLTGRKNYLEAGAALGLDLVNNPELVATPEVGFRTTVWFWVTHGLNQLADLDSEDGFKRITHRINGGYNHLEERQKYWHRARKVLGLE